MKGFDPPSPTCRSTHINSSICLYIVDLFVEAQLLAGAADGADDACRDGVA